MSIATPTPNSDRDAVLEFLEIARKAHDKALDEYKRAYQIRRQSIGSAKRLGLTNTEIGAALGLKESAVRMMIKRAGEQA